MDCLNSSEISSNQVSIQSLLGDLCKSIYKDVNGLQGANVRTPTEPHGQQNDDIIPKELLKKCTKKAFEMLLKKSNAKSLPMDRSMIDEGYSDVFDPINELRFVQFEYSLFVGAMKPYFGPYGLIKERQEKKILDKLSLIKECVQFIDDNEYFCNEQCDGYAMLWFLTLFKNKSNVDKLLTVEPYFTLALDEMPVLPVSQPKYFKLNWDPNSELRENPYCEGMRKVSKRSMLFNLPGLTKTVRINGKSRNMPEKRPNLLHPFDLIEAFTGKANAEKNIVAEVLDNISNHIRTSTIYHVSNRWEHRGYHIPLNKHTDPEVIASLYEKKFCSELPGAPLNLQALVAAEQQQRFNAIIVDEATFNEHIKLLLIGIETESFIYNPSNMTFSLLQDLTIKNVRPQTIAHFVLDFLECGACYKRLKFLIATNNFQLKYQGFVFKALCSSLDSSLETFRNVVIANKSQTIAELFVRISPLIRHVRVLAKLLAVHPQDANHVMEYGSQFLGYLYERINGIFQVDVYALLVFILSQCCDVYFRRFSNWIYNGIVEDPGQELFIEFINYYLPKTKSYFDKAFVVKQSSVPGFLQGWEHAILLCGKYSNILKLYNPTHPLFTITPPQITVCLSFAQIEAVEAECQRYQIQAQLRCGRRFALDDLLKQRQMKRAELVNVIAERTKQNMEQWKAEREKISLKKHEKNEKDRLELMKQIEDIRAEKLRKRREEVEADREYLRQCEQAELRHIERENEQRRKNIEYYNELAEIVDAQQKRAETEIAELESKLSKNDAEEQSPDDDILVEETSEAVEEAVVVHPPSASDDSDSDVYFDADKSILSNVSSKEYQSPEEFGTPKALPRSKSDLINSNTVDLGLDRAKNRANVLKSNIDLNPTTEETQKVVMPSRPLTEAHKNRLKTLQHEYGLIDDNANSHEITIQAAPAELSELQKNRNRVLASEFGITDITVNVPTEKRPRTDFDRIQEMARGHTHTFAEMDDLNANKPLTDLQINRKKVMAQEYGLGESGATNEAATLRNKLKASLSLDLDNAKTSLVSPKACQSDFAVSPMSTTSDELMACSMNEPNGVESTQENNDLKLDCSLAANSQNGVEQFTGETEERPTPLSALNTAGIERKKNGFNFNTPYNSQLSFSDILRPTPTSSSIFDITSRLSATKNMSTTPITPVKHPSKSLTKSELQDLAAGNLPVFLEQSFTMPLQMYSNILNNEILKIFFCELDILSHFESLRNYFFMMDGEFASNVSDGLISKLREAQKPVELFNSYTLHAILEGAIQSSLMSNDKNAEKLSFVIPNIPDTFEHSSPNVLSDLQLTYKVDWPLNLLLSVEAIEQYNKVFQHLLKLRRITLQLDEGFYKLKDIRKQSSDKIQRSAQFRNVQQMRHKLLCFVNALQNHITSVALDGSWHKFQNDLKSVKSMEDLYIKHTKYVKRIMFLCILNKSSRDFYARIEDIFVVILRFCSKLQAKAWKCDDCGEYTHPNYDKLIRIEEDFTNLIKFIIYAANKMSNCGYQAEISEFINMININGFYS